ncbi:MAG TPA: BTAD domain-containing putative transcriptional regulator [Pilimelia sp.]|nr:BTAD domain-containing putative transcriptional regulator [Pilimelia sp.]
MEFRVLGPLEVRADGVALPLGTRKQQIALAVLILNAGRVVRVVDLVDELWPQAPPASAVANARSYAARLRRLFESVEPGRDRLRREPGGYLLRLEPAELDLSVFAAHAAAGRDESRRGEPSLAVARFAAALACWRGRMLAGLGDGPILGPRRAAAEDERLAVTEDLAEARLASDQPGEAVALMREHVRAQPLRERGHLLLMRALYAVGDVAGALSAYAECRAALKEQLGIEPGPPLQDLHRSMLDRDVAVEPPTRPAAASPAAARPVPRQLPLDVYGFTGRGTELARLDAILSAGRDHPTAVVISALAGTAGVGKTATAVHWAHHVREEFPDGQLYINLRGFDPSGSPVQVAEAVRGFLDAFDVQPARIPADVPAQVALYRSLLANRRVLIVLDNARDAEQVRPLLPGSPGCLAVVTSRNQLAGLVATEGAHPITLDLLTATEARALLTRRLGADRLAAEPDAVDEIINRCARLPLALTIAAARAATRPGDPLSTIAAELRQAGGGLDVLTDDDPTSDVRAVFSWSYHTLSAASARLFRLLGLHPGPDITVPAAASLAGAPDGQVRRQLTELTRAHLTVEHRAGRYTLHDLLRAYAAELTQTIDGEAERHAALRRILDHYLHTSYAADRLLEPHVRHQIIVAAARPGVKPEALADHDAALAWFAAEHQVLLAAIAGASGTVHDVHTWQLARTLRNFLIRRGLWQDMATTARAALDAAQRLGDRAARAFAHYSLAHAYGLLGRKADADVHVRRSLALYEELGDHAGQGHAYFARAWIAGLRDRPSEALDHLSLALSMFRAVGDQVSLGRALGGVGWYHSELGDHQRALAHCEQALTLQREIGDHYGESDTWHGIGCIHHHLRNYAEAVACHERAIDLARSLGDPNDQATYLDHLGDNHLGAGDVDAARTAWREALAILSELGHPDAGTVRAKLAELGPASRLSGRRAP